MILNLLVLLLILLITLYLATQGMLSALLALVTATFSSILAMALLEPLQGIIGGFRPEFARGATFLLLFLLIFSATRIPADILVPRNIKLPLWVNRGLGGTIGFFAGMVVVGTIILGIEMLPVPRSILGFDRFPNVTTLQPQQGETPGLPTQRMSGIWFGPDRFVQAIWKGASGRGLGGSTPWSLVHADISVESYGYRNNSYKGSLRALPPELFDVKAAWSSADAKACLDRGIVLEPGKRIVMVRTEVKKGTKAPQVSSDEDNFLRVTATQVRLLTNRARQYYPVGYLNTGTQFEPLTLDSGHLVEDYPSGSNPVYQDWVFQIEDEEKPQAIELKQLSRMDLTGLVQDQIIAPLSRGAYPPRGYLRDLVTVHVAFEAPGKTIQNAKVYILQPTTLRRDVDSELDPAFSHAEEILSQMSAGSGGWTTEFRPGLPGQGMVRQVRDRGREMKNSDRNTPVSWTQVLPLLFVGQATPDAQINLAQLPQYIANTLEPLWSGGTMGRALLNSGVPSPDVPGRVTLEKVQPGQCIMVATLQTERAFYVWVDQQEYKAASEVNRQFRAVSSGQGTATYRIDLDATQ